MTIPEDPGTARLERVVEVYDDHESHRERRFAGLTPRTIGIACAISVGHAAALLAGQFAVAAALLVVTLVGVAIVVTDRIPNRAREWSR